MYTRIILTCEVLCIWSIGVCAIFRLQVLKELEIEESDYFGLRYKGKHGSQRWLNSRNPALRELKIAGATSPYQLELCVKFFVPPKQLFQPETRCVHACGAFVSVYVYK